MPNTIQDLVTVRRTVPPQAKPAENRSTDRKDDFQQHLDDAAANKPAERPEAPAKSGKADGKKSAGKTSAAEKSKGRAKSSPNPADDEAPESTDPTADAPAPATSDDPSAAGDAQATEPSTVLEDSSDSETEDDTAEVLDTTPADPTALAQSAAAATPAPPSTTTGSPADPGAESDATATESASESQAVAPAGKAGRTATRVKAVGKDAEEQSSDDPAGGDPDAEDSVVALANALTGTSNAGTQGDGGSPDDSSQQPANAPAAPVKKPAAIGETNLGLGAPRADIESKPAKSGATTGTAGRQGAQDIAAAAAAASQVAEFATPAADEDKATKTPTTHDAPAALPLDAAGAASAQGPQAASGPKVAPQPAPPPPPEAQFADANHEPIVTGVKAQLLPHGGSMQIRLDPPELGALQVSVEMRDGAMTATFQTSNEEATRLLSHSLNQLKHVLEGQGVSVERLQVQQAPKGESQSGAGGDGSKDGQQQRQNWQDEHAARQEQQRKEVLRRMWRRVSGVADPIDVTA